MEVFKKIIAWLATQSIAMKVIAIIATALIAVILLFSSCSATQLSRLPDISDNKIGAEGIISKEKRSTRETKWYFKPEAELYNNLNTQ